MSDSNATREARQILSSSVGTPSSPYVAQEVTRLSGGNLPMFTNTPAAAAGGSFPWWISVPAVAVILGLYAWGQAQWGNQEARRNEALVKDIEKIQSALKNAPLTAEDVRYLDERNATQRALMLFLEESFSYAPDRKRSPAMDELRVIAEAVNEQWIFGESDRLIADKYVDFWGVRNATGWTRTGIVHRSSNGKLSGLNKSDLDTVLASIAFDVARVVDAIKKHPQHADLIAATRHVSRIWERLSNIKAETDFAIFATKPKVDAKRQ